MLYRIFLSLLLPTAVSFKFVFWIQNKISPLMTQDHWTLTKHFHKRWVKNWRFFLFHLNYVNCIIIVSGKLYHYCCSLKITGKWNTIQRVSLVQPRQALFNQCSLLLLHYSKYSRGIFYRGGCALYNCHTGNQHIKHLHKWLKYYVSIVVGIWFTCCTFNICSLFQKIYGAKICLSWNIAKA